MGSVGHPSTGAIWARATKYMANSPAKNISSLDSHTMVPTDTMFGLFSEWTRWVIAVPEFAAAVVTVSSMTCEGPEGADRRPARRRPRPVR
ncbi:hypothetical protein GCM10027047_00300 [Rhodococcus aerolatus]